MAGVSFFNSAPIWDLLHLMLEVVDECYLHADLHDRDDAVDDVQTVWEVFDADVEAAGDDGEDHVQEEEDGGEAKQGHVQVHLGAEVKSFRS